MGIGLKIKELASKENITLAELAKRIGKTKQAVYEMVEKEDVNTSILRTLCSEFNVPISYFFEEGSHVHVTASNNSQAVGYGNITHADDINRINLLEEKIKLLEGIIADKERLIEILMKK